VGSSDSQGTSIQIITLSENTAARAGIVAEWGFSVLIDACGCRVLLDTGQTFSAAYNAIELGIDLSRVDKIVFSHGHYDHTGGLLHILKLINKEVEVIAHPDIWSDKYIKPPREQVRYIGIPFSRQAAEAAHAVFKLTKKPVWITQNVVTSGEIPITNEYEKIDSALYVKKSGQLEPDPLWDDQAVFIKSDKGLIIVLGCAHRGIINTIRHAQDLTGVERIYAVIGGTHLISASRQRIELTVAELKKVGVQKLGVSHCTGLPAAAVLAHRFGDAFFFNNAGARIEL